LAEALRTDNVPSKNSFNFPSLDIKLLGLVELVIENSLHYY
jgi:hypothetical protein